MKCPHCGEPLLIADRQGIEIDYCRACRGIWIQRGELDKLLDRPEISRRPGPFTCSKPGGFLADLFNFD